MDITLPRALEAFVQEMVASGRYVDASDVIRNALREFEEQFLMESPELEAEILKGVRSPHYEVTEETYNEIRAKAKSMR